MFKNIFLKMMPMILISVLSGAAFGQENETGQGDKADKKDPINFPVDSFIQKHILAQEEPPRTLIDTDTMRFSAYGAPVVRFSNINNTLGLFTGGRGGLIINDSFVIGGGGFGMVLPDIVDSRGEWSGTGYGGFMMEYYFFPKNVVNFSIGAIIGAGGAYGSPDLYDSYFIVEPEVNVFVNVTKYFRLGVGASYRYTSKFNVGTITDADLKGYTVTLLLEFGKF